MVTLALLSHVPVLPQAACRRLVTHRSPFTVQIDVDFATQLTDRCPAPRPPRRSGHGRAEPAGRPAPYRMVACTDSRRQVYAFDEEGKLGTGWEMMHVFRGIVT